MSTSRLIYDMLYDMVRSESLLNQYRDGKKKKKKRADEGGREDEEPSPAVSAAPVSR